MTRYSSAHTRIPSTLNKVTIEHGGNGEIVHRPTVTTAQNCPTAHEYTGEQADTFTVPPWTVANGQTTTLPSLNHLPGESEKSLVVVAYRKQSPR
jgi:hypothetical protein